ncbi:hypothetical protein [Tolypothrix sp. VBCCA 56010]|uniref:hypothetical protein n=1 Tax=Tolypothrix sp. VBCCA 56010 TaxID=3137731 RepID=UPI003D7E9E1D
MGHWALGNGQLFNGHWAMGIKRSFLISRQTMPHAPCPMPHDGRCFKPGNPSNALPPPCPMPNAHYQQPTNYAIYRSSKH